MMWLIYPRKNPNRNFWWNERKGYFNGELRIECIKPEQKRYFCLYCFVSIQHFSLGFRDNGAVQQYQTGNDTSFPQRHLDGSRRIDFDKTDRGLIC